MTKIEWTNETWNPTRGCARISEGCRNCYAERQAHRFSGRGGPYEGLTRMTGGGPRWTGEVRFVPEMLDAPLRWRKPRMVFVNSMSDLFHESLSDEQIAAVFGVMAACQQHTFQVLTKRPGRMREWFRWMDVGSGKYGPNPSAKWPLQNVWLGVSAENQATADERISLLLQTPAAVRWVSAEPLLSGIDMQYRRGWLSPFKETDQFLSSTARINWFVRSCASARRLGRLCL